MGYRNIKKKLAVLSLSAAFGAAIPPLWHWTQGNLSPVPVAPNQHTDAIVVFTGSKGRISRGSALYAAGLAEKLLISGLDPNSNETAKFTRRAMIGFSNGITLDFDATNTIQNARNTARWAKETGVQSLRLVTSQDHMPRAYFELRRLLPTSIALYADPLPRDPNDVAMDNESNRLICRAYETALDVTFCYGARKIMRDFGIL